MYADSARLDNPKPAIQRLRRQGGKHLVQQQVKQASGHSSRCGKKHDPGGMLRREAQHLGKIGIERNQHPSFTRANLENLLVGRTAQSLGCDGRYVVPRLTQTILAAAPEVFVELEFHAAAFVSAGIMRSRAISAP